MKRIGFFIGAVVFMFVLATANTAIFADSCCNAKKDTHECKKECADGCVKKVSSDESSDKTCPVCGEAADSKGQEVDTKHAGETIHLCCEGCLNAYNKNPDKYSKKKKRREVPVRKQRNTAY